MIHTLKTMTAAAALCALPMMASAVTITAGDIEIGQTGNQEAGDSASFVFTADGDVFVSDFVSFSSVGFSGGSDIEQIDFGYTGASITDVTTNYLDSGTITPAGATTQGNAQLAGFFLADGESFELFFNYGAGGALTTTSQFNFAVAAVPLPAGGLMLIGGIAGFAALKRRKKAA